jgi:hypothetical protein
MKNTALTLSFLAATSLLSQAALVWTVGSDDPDGLWWPIDGIGGGAAADFLQENGVINALPGNPANSGTGSGNSDNDYYFRGNYLTASSGYSYVPVGLVAADEPSWERAFAAGDLDLRVHFTLPNTYTASDLVTISFDPANLHNVGVDTRFGIEIWMNNVMVRAEQVVTIPQLNQTYTTTPFTLGSVNAGLNGTTDNIVSLRGISYNGAAPSGGNWMGIDYVSMDITPVPEPSGALLTGGLLAGGLLLRRRRSVR